MWEVYLPRQQAFDDMFLLLLLSSILPQSSGAPPLPCSSTQQAMNFSLRDGDDFCRSSWAVFLPCIFTLIFTSWALVHPNASGLADSPRKVFGRRVATALIAILFPEIIVYLSIRERRKIQTMTRDFAECPDDAHQPWTNTHGYFLHMGGFVLYTDAGSPVQILNRTSLVDYHSYGMIDWPKITAGEIRTKNRPDLIFCVALLQIMRSVASLVARATKGLKSTPLEYFTAAICTTNVLFLIISWGRPPGLSWHEPVYLKSIDRPSPAVDHNPQQPGDAPVPGVLSSIHREAAGIWHAVRFAAVTAEEVLSSELSCFNVLQSNHLRDLAGAPLLLPMFFTGLMAPPNLIYFIASFGDFDSETGQFLWGVSTIFLILAPCALGLVLPVQSHFVPLLERLLARHHQTRLPRLVLGIVRMLTQALIASIFLSYLLVRITMVISAFIS